MQIFMLVSRTDQPAYISTPGISVSQKNPQSQRIIGSAARAIDAIQS
jgi:hypothetical protein